jgi:hypothetical protein
MHYVSLSKMYALEFFVYNVHPFGLKKNLTEKLPRKLELKEIIAASNIKGWGKEYVDHEPVHHLEPSEFY